MNYKITFKHWIDWSQEGFDNVTMEEIEKEKSRLEKFLVSSDSEENARKYAERFEGLETNAYEGFGSIVEVSLATKEESLSLQYLSIYEETLKNRNKMFKNE